MSNGFVVGGCLLLQKSQSLAGVRIQMPEGGEVPFVSRKVESRQYCDVNPSLSIGADFYFLHVEGAETKYPFDEAIQAIRDFKLRPASNGESYSIAQSDFDELYVATAAASARPRPRFQSKVSKEAVVPGMEKICLFSLGGQMITADGKHNPLMVRHAESSENVRVKGIIAQMIRPGWYIPVTDYRVESWK